MTSPTNRTDEKKRVNRVAHDFMMDHACSDVGVNRYDLENLSKLILKEIKRAERREQDRCVRVVEEQRNAAPFATITGVIAAIRRRTT